MMRCLSLSILLSLSSFISAEETNTNIKLRGSNPKFSEDKHNTLPSSPKNDGNVTDSLKIISTNEEQVSDVREYNSTDITSKQTRITRDLANGAGHITVKRAVIKKSKTNIFAVSQCNDVLKSDEFVQDIEKGAQNALILGEAKLSERFQGLKQESTTGTLGMSDRLVGSVSNPLRLERNPNPRENLYVTKNCNGKTDKCKLEIEGRGPAGFKGPGAISILFKRDQAKVQISFAAEGRNSADTAEMKFYMRDGTLIETINVNISKKKNYEFAHSEGSIAGISIAPHGDVLSWHSFKVTRLCFN